ncbi:MAG TPA: PBP1A family penicillin-binding protein [Longimicrobiaceae bacterium]|nr:PBP1A family penicillin-binding protein [Longimicrobiaceae bacterium]
MRSNTSGRPGSARRTITVLLAVLALLLVAGFAWVWFAPCGLGGCAPVSDLARFQAEGSELLDVDGEPFGTLATVNRRVVPLDSLPPHLIQAFLAVEDRRFYEHGGVDWRRMGGAMRSTVGAVSGSGGRLEGGSTITMQLARNLFPERLRYTDRTPRRKLMEVRIARQIERAFSKDKILELYLNHIYLGSGAYGVEAAAQSYFGKSVADLDLAEAALLGGLPKAPSVLDPTRNREGALERRNLVLREMAEAGFISAEEAAAAREEPVRLARVQRSADAPERSYFIERVRRELENIIGDRFYTAGMKVYTTLDRTAQAAAEQELARQLDAIESGRYGSYRHATYAEARGVAEETGTTPYLQGMVVVMDAQTGAVRALVGGRDFNDSKFDRAVQALRQPGSAFKPFVYLAALERYRSPVHTIEDAPVRLTLSGGKVWEPQNYTGQYDGEITLRESLARSKNAATVRLAQDVGLGSVIRTARQLGITDDIPDLPSTALGAAEVRPLELVQTYAAFANGGNRVEPHFVRRIEDRDGIVVWEANPERQRVLDPAVAFVLTSILRDVVDRGTGTAVRAAGFSAPAAGKTGTTNAATDVWFVGYTPDLVAGVWIGLDNPQTIVRGASGGTLAAPVWGQVMRRIYSDRSAPSEWSPPSGVVTEQVDRTTGAVVSEWCPAQGPTYTEYFIGAAPRGICPRDRSYYLAESGRSWVDEEWGSGSDWESTTPTAEQGIDWPELEELRREREGRRDVLLRRGERRETSIDPRDTVQPSPAEPHAGREERDRPAARDTFIRYDTIVPAEVLGQPARREPPRSEPPGQE